jgi:hypothetical protein
LPFQKYLLDVQDVKVPREAGCRKWPRVREPALKGCGEAALNQELDSRLRGNDGVVGNDPTGHIDHQLSSRLLIFPYINHHL